MLEIGLEQLAHLKIIGSDLVEIPEVLELAAKRLF
jgi:hypothetical protein